MGQCLMLRYGVSILFRLSAQNLVGVNGCYVKDFFPRFGHSTDQGVACDVCVRKRRYDYGFHELP